MKTLLPTEAEIQKTLIEYLRLRKYYVQRLNSGAMRMQYKGKDYMMRMSEAGTPDIMAFKGDPYPKHYLNLDGTVSQAPALKLYFIEVKRTKKIRASEAQVAKMKELESYGARCLVACSIEDLKAEGI